MPRVLFFLQVLRPFVRRAVPAKPENDEERLLSGIYGARWPFVEWKRLSIGWCVY